MPGDVRVKYCGLRSPADMAAAVTAGAAYVGFVLYPPSPRFVTMDEARLLAFAAPTGLARVALVVDADDALYDDLIEHVPVDMLQLHGHESPARVAEIRDRYGLPVMKALGVAGEGDLAGLLDHSLAADQLLIDAKPPAGAALPGGNGTTFDWRLLAGRRWLRPWMLAGGLTAANVAEAIRLTGARQVDVSSGIESAPGVKDTGRIADFAAAVRA